MRQRKKKPRPVEARVLSKSRMILPRPGKDTVQAACGDTALRARQEILTRLDQYQKDNGLSCKATVLAFVQAVEAASQVKLAKDKPQFVQIESFGLPYTIIRDAKGWNARNGAWRISARTVYNWKALSGDNSGAQARPRVQIAQGTGKEFAVVTRFMSTAPDVMIDLLVEFYADRFAHALRRAGWVVQSELVQRQS
ncbi:MAG: hypothetical protein LBE86_00895 [Gemmobacter sp.]|jgi:hypothetical protein|nr:hypothetical protein [Gemmobacter sp.]